MARLIFLLMLALSWLYFRVSITGTALGAAFLGIQAAVIALIVRAVHRIGEHILHIADAVPYSLDPPEQGLALYLNGTEVSTKSVTGAMANSSGPLQIGGNNVWGEWFQGQIDEVRIYDRALTALGAPDADPEPPPATLLAAAVVAIRDERLVTRAPLPAALRGPGSSSWAGRRSGPAPRPDHG